MVFHCHSLGLVFSQVREWRYNIVCPYSAVLVAIFESVYSDI